MWSTFKLLFMKYNIPALLILLICCVQLSAQMTAPIRVNAGDDLYTKLGHEIYLYPAFTTGTVAFRDGKMSQAKLNYNFLNGEVQFINDTGDTLSLANELTIKYLTIAKDSFFYSDGYL